MRQYEKIWVPDDKGRHEVRHIDFETVSASPVVNVRNAIVLSVEELRDMWEECRDETWQDARPSAKYEKAGRLPGFEGYLQSKGIGQP